MLYILFACKDPNVIELPCLVCWSSRALEESLGPLGSLKKNSETDFEGQYSARRILLKILRTKQMRSCHRNSHGFAAITPATASIKNKLHATKPQEFLWFCCNYTSNSFNQKQVPCHQTIGTPMFLLQTHQLQLQSETSSMPSKHNNSFGFDALVPTQA